MNRYIRITEKTFKLNKAVDYLYDRYFRKHVKKLKKIDTGYTSFIQNKKVISTIQSEELPGKEIQLANQTNPVSIHIGFSKYGNAYMPSKNKIYYDIINKSALEALYSNPSFTDYTSIINELPPEQIDGYLKEFDEGKIKATIYHELSHWLNDTFHNRNLSKMLQKAKIVRDAGQNFKSIVTQGKGSTYVTDYEIDAQIHAIKQLKRNNKKNWDYMSFEDVVKLSSSFIHIKRQLNTKLYKEWKKLIKKRMVREKLLGKMMR